MIPVSVLNNTVVIAFNCIMASKYKEFVLPFCKEYFFPIDGEWEVIGSSLDCICLMLHLMHL